MKGKFGLITFIFLAAAALMYLSFPKTPEIKEITKDINITTR
jgi:hypothetical protein